MATMWQVEGLNDAAYATLKAAAKTELPFPVTLRRHTQQYAYHHIDIRPTAKTQHRFTDTHVAAIRDFCDRHGLDDGLHAVSNRAGYHPCVFWQGFNYLARHTTVA
jgi:xylose isomerase